MSSFNLVIFHLKLKKKMRTGSLLNTRPSCYHDGARERFLNARSEESHEARAGCN